MTDRDKIKSYIPMAKFIAAVCGPRFEVVLHCLDSLEHSIVFIENGYITGRKEGDGLIDFGLQTIYDERYTKDDFTANIRAQPLGDNRVIRFSSFYIKNDKGHIIGFLGVNVDVTEIEHFHEFLDSELFFQNKDSLDGEGDTHLALSATNMLDAALDDAMNALHCTDVSTLTKDEKIKIISVLNKRNIFALKGVVSITAKKLRISEPTVYRYLRELKQTKD